MTTIGGSNARKDLTSSSFSHRFKAPQITMKTKVHLAGGTTLQMREVSPTTISVLPHWPPEEPLGSIKIGPWELWRISINLHREGNALWQVLIALPKALFVLLPCPIDQQSLLHGISVLPNWLWLLNGDIPAMNSGCAKGKKRRRWMLTQGAEYYLLNAATPH